MNIIYKPCLLKISHVVSELLQPSESVWWLPFNIGLKCVSGRRYYHTHCFMWCWNFSSVKFWAQVAIRDHKIFLSTDLYLNGHSPKRNNFLSGGHIQWSLSILVAECLGIVPECPGDCGVEGLRPRPPAFIMSCSPLTLLLFGPRNNWLTKLLFVFKNKINYFCYIRLLTFDTCKLLKRSSFHLHYLPTFKSELLLIRMWKANFVLFIVLIRISSCEGQIDSTVAGVLALHLAEPGSIPARRDP